MSDQDVSKLYKNALSYDFHILNENADDFECHDTQDYVDLYLMKAQIKLLLSDQTAIHDLRQAKTLSKSPRMPFLFSEWKPNSPNSFIVFDSNPGSVQSFLKILTPCGELLRDWYGEQGYHTAMQIKSEILYFMGKPNEAAALSEGLFQQTESNYLYHVLTGYTLLRCYLAMGKIHAAEAVILEIIRYAKKSGLPHCMEMYHTIREWVNLTTGWSGDSPRYQKTTAGDILPVLDDRITAVRKGISAPSTTEEPFVLYARRRHKSSYTMRELYMDIFGAMEAFRNGLPEQARENFLRAYRIAKPNDLLMPFAEYGGQIHGLTDYMTKQNDGIDPVWTSRMLELSRQYEKNLSAYRS